MLEHYQYSLHKTLQSIYPETEFLPWLFHQVPSGYWRCLENQKKCLDWISSQLGIETMNQWFLVKPARVKKVKGARGLLAHYEGSLLKALESLYPEFEWPNIWNSSQGQKRVSDLLRKLFQSRGEDLDIRLNHKISDPTSKMQVEFDIYIPSLAVALEYQGDQHYRQTFRGSLHSQQQRDAEKKEICRNFGISLVEIPYWWDNSLETLITSIQKVRPDICFPDHAVHSSSKSLKPQEEVQFQSQEDATSQSYSQ